MAGTLSHLCPNTTHYSHEMLRNALATCGDPETEKAYAYAGLDQLRTFLIDSAVGHEFYGIHTSIGPPNVKDAYEAACRMFAIGKRMEAESGRTSAAPILEYEIDASS